MKKMFIKVIQGSSNPADPSVMPIGRSQRDEFLGLFLTSLNFSRDIFKIGSSRSDAHTFVVSGFPFNLVLTTVYLFAPVILVVIIVPFVSVTIFLVFLTWIFEFLCVFVYLFQYVQTTPLSFHFTTLSHIYSYIQSHKPSAHRFFIDRSPLTKNIVGLIRSQSFFQIGDGVQLCRHFFLHQVLFSSSGVYLLLIDIIIIIMWLT